VKWVVALAVVLLLLLFIKRGQKKSGSAGPGAGHPQSPATGRKLQNLKALEGAVCIFEEGDDVLKGRLVQVEESSGAFLFQVQVLRAEGLSDSREERIHLEATPNQLEQTGKLIHCRQTHWRLFFARDLIEKVEQLGRSRTDIKAIKRVLLEHQMK